MWISVSGAEAGAGEARAGVAWLWPSPAWPVVTDPRLPQPVEPVPSTHHTPTAQNSSLLTTKPPHAPLKRKSTERLETQVSFPHLQPREDRQGQGLGCQQSGPSCSFMLTHPLGAATWLLLPTWGTWMEPLAPSMALAVVGIWGANQCMGDVSVMPVYPSGTLRTYTERLLPPHCFVHIVGRGLTSPGAGAPAWPPPTLILRNRNIT